MPAPFLEFALSSFVLATHTSAGIEEPEIARIQEAPPGHVELLSDGLRVVIADNEAYGPQHRAGYSGVAELALRGTDENLFVPFYSGLNFEHVFSGDESSYGFDLFEPRRAPMSLKQVSAHHVELHQERTRNWPLRSHLVYELAGVDAIDLSITCTPLEDAWSKHGYVGLFFASYIHAPEEMAIEFIGRDRPGEAVSSADDAAPRWIRARTPAHGEQACHRAAGVRVDPAMDSGFPITLARGQSDFEFEYPFYFGLSHGRVLVLMFDRPTPASEVRFAQSPSGGGKGNPAWDFLFLQRDYEVGRPFTFRVRAVYREFRGREDVVRAYEAWSGEAVVRPEVLRPASRSGGGGE